MLWLWLCNKIKIWNHFKRLTFQIIIFILFWINFTSPTYHTYGVCSVWKIWLKIIFTFWWIKTKKRKKKTSKICISKSILTELIKKYYIIYHIKWNWWRNNKIKLKMMKIQHFSSIAFSYTVCLHTSHTALPCHRQWSMSILNARKIITSITDDS